VKPEHSPGGPGPDPRLVLGLAGCLGFSAVITQLTLLRELLSGFAGNELTLGIILGCWLILSGLGAWIARARALHRNQPRVLAYGMIGIALLPVLLVTAIRVLRDVVFLRGAAASPDGTIAFCLAALLPYCLLSGCLLALAATPPPGSDPDLTRRVYVADCAGAVIGGIAFTFLLIRSLDHFSLLLIPLAACIAILTVFALKARQWMPFALGTLAATALIIVCLRGDLDASTTRLQFPGQEIVYCGNSPYGRLVVTRLADQLTFVENGTPLFSAGNVEAAEESAHYAMAQRPEAKNVLLISGGLSGTAREVSRYGVPRIAAVELDPAVIDITLRYFPGNVPGGRTSLVAADGRSYVRRSDGRFDVIIIGTPDPTTCQINRFYTREFIEAARRSLTPQGVLSIAIGRYENVMSRASARLLSIVHTTLGSVFKNVLLLPGGRVYALASDGPLTTDIAGRLGASGIEPRFVRPSYLDAILKEDRLADMRRAVSVPAPVNTDFAPVLYFEQMLHWLSQYRTSWRAPAILIAVALIVYLIRIGSVPFTVFTAGLTSTTVEVILLLMFQAQYGSVYQDVGLIVTSFMMGLAVGSLLAGRFRHRWTVKHLAILATTLGLYAALLPLALSLMTRTSNVAAGKAVFVFLTFVLASLAGIQFPAASRVDRGKPTATASRLFLADYVGASIGALTAGTFLLPLLGVWRTCVGTSVLCLLSGLIVLGVRGGRKA